MVRQNTIREQGDVQSEMKRGGLEWGQDRGTRCVGGAITALARHKMVEGKYPQAR